MKVDHSRAFTGTRTLLFAMTKIDRPFYDRVKALTEQDLRREIGDLLETGALPALLSRRDAIVKTFEDAGAEERRGGGLRAVSRALLTAEA